MYARKGIIIRCMMGGEVFLRAILHLHLLDLDTSLFFFAGQTHVFRPRTDLGRVLLALAPLLGAAMIAISRCEDYRHDVYDVTCGSILGISLAYFSYRRYFPRLQSSKCHEPHPSREAVFNQGFGKIKNDEETEIGRARESDISDNESDAS